MRPAHLLDHEAVCPDCHGEGRIECEGVHPKRLGAISIMESPDCWTELCDTCDQTGVVLNDRRESERPSGSPLVEAFRQVRAELDAAQALTVAQAQRIDELVRENRRMREAIDKAARVIERRAASKEAPMPKRTDLVAVRENNPKGGMPNADGDLGADRPRSGSGRRRSVLTYEGRVPGDPMNSPLNPERDPAPFAALRP